MLMKKIVWDVFNNNIKFDFQPFVKNSKDMDFLKEILELNNIIYLDKLTKEQNLNEEEKIKFIQKYNKRNNRLFTPCKKYKISHTFLEVTP